MNMVTEGSLARYPHNMVPEWVSLTEKPEGSSVLL